MFRKMRVVLSVKKANCFSRYRKFSDEFVARGNFNMGTREEKTYMIPRHVQSVQSNSTKMIKFEIKYGNTHWLSANAN